MTDSEKLNRIKLIIELAVDWSKNQIMPESDIVRSALKDIQRVVYAK